jgi:hypothetical protein
MHHQVNGFTHANEGIKNLFKKKVLVRLLKKNSSIKVPTPNIYFSKYGFKVHPQ